MGMLSGIKNAKPSDGGNYIKAGNYLLSADVLKGITSRKGDDMFVSEWGVIESTNENSPPGSHVSWLANLTKHDAALGNVKSCISALSGVKSDELDDDDAEEAISDDNPLSGRLVRCEAVGIETKAGNPFTKCFWHVVDDDVQKTGDTLRKDAGLV